MARTDESAAAAASRIEALVAPHVAADLFSGVILVTRESQTLFDRAYGFASWELGVPNGPSNRFGIGSITKVMTEVVVRKLEGAERLDLDAPVARYLPGFPRGPQGGSATLRHLLFHRAGVPHRVTDPIDETQPLGPGDIVGRVREEGLLFEPGARRSYSSAGYTSLARVIEVVEGERFEETLAEKVFRPAKMTSAVSETGPDLMPGRAVPHRLGVREGRIVVKSVPYKDLRFLTGAGSVYATAQDLTRFVQALQDGVFGRELAREALGGDPKSWRGWAGRTNGYEASVDVLPAEDLVFVLLTNLQSATNWQVREQVRRILRGDPGVAIPLPPPVAEPFEDSADLPGVYGPAEIRRVDGRLFRGDNEFYPIAGKRYYIPASGFTMRFRRDANGSVDALVTRRADGEESINARSTAA